MVVAVDLDVAIQIVSEGLALFVLGQMLEQVLKHQRDGLFSPIEERPGYVRSRPIQGAQGVQDKVSSVPWDASVLKAFLRRLPSNQIG